jgi:hypothetical protein
MKDGSKICEFKTGAEGRAGGSTEIQRADASSFGEIRTDEGRIGAGCEQVRKSSSVVDPDPAFQVNPDPVRIWIRILGFDDQKLGKIQLKI